MIVADCETSGLDPLTNSILSIGAVDFFNPDRTFYVECQPFPNASISGEALAVNGFTTESLSDPNKPSADRAIRDFMKWLEQSDHWTIAGGNPSFDLRFLEKSANRAGYLWKYGYRTVDLHSLVYAHHLSRGIPLPRHYRNTGYIQLWVDRCFEYAGLGEEPKPHNALTGAKMAAEAINRMIYGDIWSTEFAEQSVPEYLEQNRLLENHQWGER